MNMAVWNCQGVGNEAFRTHAHKLCHLHCPQNLIIVESHIANDRAHVVIDTPPYSHSKRVDLIGFSGGIWMLWNENSRLIVEILTTSEYSSMHSSRYPPTLLLFFSWLFMLHLILINVKFYGNIYQNYHHLLECHGSF